MTRLTLATTMETSFRDIRYDPSNKAFHDYNRRIGYLAEHGRLRIEDVRELIKPFDDISNVIEETARVALAETVSGEAMYLPGYTAVVVHSNSTILGAQEKPNNIPKLQSYGPSLMWAMRKIGHERMAVAQSNSSAAVQPGYRLVSGVLSGKSMEDMPCGARHHVGGSTIQNYLYPNSISMRRFEHEILLAGVSGVVASPKFRQITRSDTRLRPIHEEAEDHFTDWLDGFDGNMFAGSIDSTLGSFILATVVGHTFEDDFSFTESVIDGIAERHDNGINVH